MDPDDDNDNASDGNGDNDDDDDENMVGRWYNWVTCGPRERRRPPILPTPPYNQWMDHAFDPEQYNVTTNAFYLHAIILISLKPETQNQITNIYLGKAISLTSACDCDWGGRS